MAFRMSRKVKNLLIEYIHKYSGRLLESNNSVEIIRNFDFDAATIAVTKALLNSDIPDKDKLLIQTIEGQERIKVFFRERLIVNYLMDARKIKYHEAKSLLNDKGTEFFEETKGIHSKQFVGRFQDYPATEKQIAYIESFGAIIKHKEELSGREASLIISCLLTPAKTKPAYFTYYIT